MFDRREIIAGASAIATVATTRIAAPAQAQPLENWPQRTVRIVSPSGAGGPSQNFRLYADHLKSVFGQSFVLENITGGSGAVGISTVLRAPPDGHTLLWASNSQTVLAPLVLPSYPIAGHRDFAPVSLMFTFPFLLVANPGLGVTTLSELIGLAKARAGQLNYGSPGIGTGGHLVTELLVKRTGIQAAHIPYQATTQQLLAAAAGTLQFTFDTVGNARGLVDSKQVVPLAVTGARRAIAAPDVPTFAELGHEGFDELFVSQGVMAPLGTPAAMIAAPNRELVALNAAGPVRERLLAASYEPGTGTPEAYGAMNERDAVIWSDVVKETGVRIKA